MSSLFFVVRQIGTAVDLCSLISFLALRSRPAPIKLKFNALRCNSIGCVKQPIVVAVFPPEHLTRISNQAEDFPPLGSQPPPDPRNYPESIQRGKRKERVMRTKILRNIFISVGAPFALAQLLVGGTGDGVQNFGNLLSAGHSPTYTTFDAPGAGTGPNQGTLALAIDPAGAITGYYIDASGVNHGFLRTTKGTITTVDVPGAGAFGTQVYSISPSQMITGVYGHGGVLHGFLRDKGGAITTFDVPDASRTVPSDINPGGDGRGMVLGRQLCVSRISARCRRHFHYV